MMKLSFQLEKTQRQIVETKWEKTVLMGDRLSPAKVFNADSKREVQSVGPHFSNESGATVRIVM